MSRCLRLGSTAYGRTSVSIPVEDPVQVLAYVKNSSRLIQPNVQLSWGRTFLGSKHMSDVVDFTSPESSERPPRTRRGGRQRRLPVPEGRQLDREYLHRCIDGLCDAMARGQEREAEGWLARLECKAPSGLARHYSGRGSL